MGDKTPKKRSIDEMIGNMTADLHNSDGQYIQLGFTPPPTPASSSPHVWSEYSIPSNPGPVHPYLHPSMVNNPDTPVYLSDLNMHYGIDSNLMKQNEMHQNYYYAHQHLMTDSRMMDGNLYGVNSNGQSPNLNQSYHMLPPDTPREIHRDVHPLGGFMPYHQSNVMDQLPQQHDYGLFNNPGDMCSRQMQQQYQPNMTNQDQLIENLVGNWVPNQTGTYSPFGCVDTGLKPTTNQQTTQTADSDSDKGIGRGFRNRQRIVAEVRPMRPSYSDVLAKSPPATVVPVKNTVRPDKVKPQTVKSGNKKNGKGSALKRQHSSGSDEHTGNGNGNGNNGGCKIQSPASTRKSTDSGNKNDAFNSLPRKWVSLDDLDSDKKLEEEVFQPEEVTRSNEPGSKKQSKKNQHVAANNWDNASSTLNNHKPWGGNGGKGAAGASAAKRPIHINNNLGTSPWANAAGPALVGEKNILKGKNCKTCGDSDKKGNAAGVKPEPKASARVGSGRSTSVSSGSQNVDKGAQGKRGGQRAKRKECATSPLAVFCRPMKQHLNRWAAVALQIVTWFLHLLSDVLGMSLRLLVHLFGFVCDWLASVSMQGYRKLGNVFVRVRIFDRLGFSSGEGSPKRWWNFWSRDKPSKTNNRSTNTENEGKRFKFPPGLENNISLPSTGEEAMKRLLACKGKDPYSILGVTPHCTDDDVKKYYKRQAFLVHPDKNNQPGAEEAFKILVHAFELIGEPERRKAYERRVAETQQVEQAWSELSDLLSQLHQKMEYAANTIRCTNCGKRHRRVAVDRPCYAARMCAQCKIHHAAREGDIWAESSMLGFLWHYYACMDGAVFDITEWAACQAENLKHLRANTHNVQYRIVLGKQQQPYSRSGGQQHRSAAGHRPAHESNSEPDLEDFLNNLYSQSAPNGAPSGDGVAPDQARGRKKGKRRK